jgi:hypothetical protein
VGRSTLGDATRSSARPNGHDTAVVNLSFTKFLFVQSSNADDAARAHLRAAGSLVARGFYNDFDADGSRDRETRETIQFLASDETDQTSAYAVQVTASYRPRLSEVEWELRRRLGDHAEIVAMEGALRAPRYTSAEMHVYAYKNAAARSPGRVSPNVIIWPLRKTDEWWEKPALERHTYFYPHRDAASGCPVKGHARSAEAGIETIFRRVFHNPDGYRREGEYDFITYFECEDRHLATFDAVAAAVSDVGQNPEWRYVVEGPKWRGRRVMRW